MNGIIARDREQREACLCSRQGREMQGASQGCWCASWIYLVVMLCAYFSNAGIVDEANPYKASGADRTAKRKWHVMNRNGQWLLGNQPGHVSGSRQRSLDFESSSESGRSVAYDLEARRYGNSHETAVRFGDSRDNRQYVETITSSDRDVYSHHQKSNGVVNAQNERRETMISHSAGDNNLNNLKDSAVSTSHKLDIRLLTKHPTTFGSSKTLSNSGDSAYPLEDSILKRTVAEKNQGQHLYTKLPVMTAASTSTIFHKYSHSELPRENSNIKGTFSGDNRYNRHHGRTRLFTLSAASTSPTFNSEFTITKSNAKKALSLDNGRRYRVRMKRDFGHKSTDSEGSAVALNLRQVVPPESNVTMATVSQFSGSSAPPTTHLMASKFFNNKTRAANNPNDLTSKEKFQLGHRSPSTWPTDASEVMSSGETSDKNASLTKLHAGLLFVAIVGAVTLLFINLAGVLCCKRLLRVKRPTSTTPLIDDLFQNTPSQRRLFLRRFSTPSAMRTTSGLQFGIKHNFKGGDITKSRGRSNSAYSSRSYSTNFV